MTPPSSTVPERRRLAILSYSSGEYDARSFRLARSAIAAGYEVVIYTRWAAGQPVTEEREGYRLIRVDPEPGLAFPWSRARARRKSGTRMAEAVRVHAAGAPAAGGRGTAGGEAAPTATARAGRWGRNPIRWPVRFVKGVVRRVRRKTKPWTDLLQMFPVRPMGWGVALESVAEPADIWHGMWAGSLPALARLRRRHGGRTIYDSRDVYMQSRDFYRLRWPLRSFLSAIERRWAQMADAVLTVNDPYADILTTQLRVPRPAVVPNTPARWTPPMPAPDLIRAATGIPATTFVALYQGQLIGERGIEQSVDAVLELPGVALVLLGYGPLGKQYAALADTPRYRGRLFVLEAVSPDQLLAWSASADVMVMPIQPTTVNHQFTTPQKLWEAVAAGVPVVASDLPGMAGVIREAGLGALCDPTDAASIAAAIRGILGRSSAERAALRRHVLGVAHERFNWETQLGTLFGVYARLGSPPPRADWAALTETGPTAAEGTPAPGAGPRIRFIPRWSPDRADAAAPDTTFVVLDTAWVPAPGERPANVVLLRELAEGLMRERDLIAEAARALHAWELDSGIAAALDHDGVSTWYGWRLGQWVWLLDELLWLSILGRLLTTQPGTMLLEFDAGADPQLLAAGRTIARRDGLEVAGEALLSPESQPFVPQSSRTPTSAPVAPATARPAAAVPASGASPRADNGPALPPEDPRRVAVLGRLASLSAEPERRLLVVQAHARQRIETPSGPRRMNVYLGPVVDRLGGTRLEPLEVDIRSAMADDAAWDRLSGPGGERSLPSDVLALASPGVQAADGADEAAAAVARLAAIRAPLELEGVDLGPALVERMVDRVKPVQARYVVAVARIRGLLRRLHPAGILLADEYHRQDWLSAARAEGIPVAAIQHGIIYRWHTGYVHPFRSPSLALPGRTYVYGSWERDVLTGTSVYAPDEVVVGGSPRLDMVAPGEPERDAVRHEVGVQGGDRMVVLSGTWGALYRRFHYPIALAELFAAPIERIHLVVKLHPSERDDGPYRRVIEEAARAGGFAPPPITIVKDIDLYRLLAAADAHLGIHSTVLTEAVAAGTPNLLAAGLQAADLLGYIEAGVAIPVQTPGDIAAALDLPRARAMDPGRREAFLRRHFEPGDASLRIADDLLGWLP